MFPCISTAEDVAKEAVKSFVINQIKEFYSYIRNYKDNVTQLEKNHIDLIACENDMKTQVKNGQDKLEKVTNEADNWFKDVRELMDGDEALEQLIDGEVRKAMEKSCLGFNLCRTFKMSKFAERKAQELESQMKKKPAGALTLPVRTEDLECVPTEFLKRLKSREYLLDKVLAKLEDDQVRAVGVYGMGAIGNHPQQSCLLATFIMAGLTFGCWLKYLTQLTKS